MKKIKDESQINNNACQNGGCSANYIWLGIAVILLIMSVAMIFGN